MAQRFAKLMLCSLALIGAKLGGEAVVDAGLETVQPGITAMLVNQVFGKCLEASSPDPNDAKVETTQPFYN